MTQDFRDMLGTDLIRTTVINLARTAHIIQLRQRHVHVRHFM